MLKPSRILESLFDCLAARLLDILFASGDRPLDLRKLSELADSPLPEVEREIQKLVRSGVVAERGRFLRDGLEERELSEDRRYVIRLGSETASALSRFRTALQEKQDSQR